MKCFRVFEVMLCCRQAGRMREFIGNPNQVEYYEEDDVEVESEVYDDGADNFIYLDPSDMGIEIDDDDDVDVDDDADEDFESFSLGDHYSSEETDYIEDDEEEESLSDEGE